jgi:hypothetical protein
MRQRVGERGRVAIGSDDQVDRAVLEVPASV